MGRKWALVCSCCSQLQLSEVECSSKDDDDDVLKKREKRSAEWEKSAPLSVIAGFERNQQAIFYHIHTTELLSLKLKKRDAFGYRKEELPQLIRKRRKRRSGSRAGRLKVKCRRLRERERWQFFLSLSVSLVRTEASSCVWLCLPSTFSYHYHVLLINYYWRDSKVCSQSGLSVKSGNGRKQDEPLNSAAKSS